MSDKDALSPILQGLIVAAMILVAAILQGRAAHAMAVCSAEPDFLLIVLACGATLVGGSQGLVLGFLTGFLTATLTTNPYVPFGTIMASRTIAGAFAAGLQRSVIRDSVWVPPLIVFGTTLVSDCVYAAMAPHAWLHRPRQWLHAEIGQILFNVVLSYPCYLLLRRFGVGVPKEDPFGLVS